jgi:hypothetical protein
MESQLAEQKPQEQPQVAQQKVVAAPTPEKKKAPPVLMPGRMGLAEEKRNEHIVDVPVGVSLEECLDPAFWAHEAPQLQPLDKIELRSEDGSWIAIAYVRFCERNYALLVLDRVINMSGERSAPAASIKHRVEWKTTQLRYCVIRNSDDKVLQSGMRSKVDAERWLIDYEKSMER